MVSAAEMLKDEECEEKRRRDGRATKCMQAEKKQQES